MLVRQMQSCMKGAGLMYQEKLAYLDCIPHLLARLHMPGVRSRCFAQFNEAPEQYQDSGSVEFMGVGSLLRADMLAMSDDGGGMSSRLAEAWGSLREAPNRRHEGGIPPRVDATYTVKGQGGLVGLAGLDRPTTPSLS